MSAPEAQRWLRFALEDLLAAEAMLGRPDTYPRHACWLAQQSAEKALKSILVFLDMDFPYSHDLDRLRDLTPEGWRVKKEHPDLAELAEWAVEARYPDAVPEAVEGDAQLATRQARAVWESVYTDLAARGLKTIP
jgi:HEPN domain-containing protein